MAKVLYGKGLGISRLVSQRPLRDLLLVRVMDVERKSALEGRKHFDISARSCRE